MNWLQKYREDYSATIKIGVPIVLGQLGIVVVGLVDNIMVGHFSTSDLAAASFVNSVFNIPILFGMGFSYGLTPLVGQFFGRGDKFRVGGLLRNSLLANFMIGLFLSVAMGIMYLNVHRMGQPEELLPLIRPYFLLQLTSLVFVMMFNSFKQFADGITDTKTSMWIMLSANLLNIIGNSLLIYGVWGLPALGLTGAGISTLASRIFMFVAFAILFFRKQSYRRYLVGYHRTTYNTGDLKVLNRMGMMVGLQMGMETALFSISGVMIGWLGTVPLAAHQVVASISTLGFMLYYGVGSAVSIRVSNFFGRGDIAGVRRATLAGTHLLGLLAISVSVFFLLVREHIGWLYTSSEEVVNLVAVLMVILVFYQFGDSLQIIFANALRGVADVTSMAVISFIGYFVIALPVSCICGFVLDWGIEGIWVGYPVGLTLTGGMMCWRFYHFLRKKG
ncbi:MATE family efflux transporter [Butyricimonas faecihominis]|jgi:MATE efflux family protein|uniref:MATE family efflux transporter n=1 Tax=Butyricimonas faecihominis TaxID=1472416 RepID=UPI00266E95AA|nr:MATE family efflux transporter [Butyricimonas faecihominis]